MSPQSWLTRLHKGWSEAAELPGREGEQMIEKLLTLILCANEGILTVSGTRNKWIFKNYNKKKINK